MKTHYQIIIIYFTIISIAGIPCIYLSFDAWYKISGFKSAVKETSDIFLSGLSGSLMGMIICPIAGLIFFLLFEVFVRVSAILFLEIANVRALIPFYRFVGRHSIIDHKGSPFEHPIALAFLIIGAIGFSIISISHCLKLHSRLTKRSP